MSVTRVAARLYSKWSYDGQWTLDEIARGFGRPEYAAVMLAEHDRGFDTERWLEYHDACAFASTATTLLIPGVQYSDPTDTIHMPVWGASAFLGEGLDPGVLLRKVREIGALALPYPARRGAIDRIEEHWWQYFTAIELWNRKYDGYAPSAAAAEVLRGRPELVPFASLHFHTSRQFHPLVMAFDLGGESTEASIGKAIRRRTSVRWPLAFRQSGSLAVLRGPRCAASRLRDAALRGDSGGSRRPARPSEVGRHRAR